MASKLRWLALVLLCSCSKPPDDMAVPGGGEVSGPASDIPKLAAAAASGEPASQRELAGRLLFGNGLPQDASAALEWAEKAARGGDAMAAVWMGRTLLGSDPPDRVAAAAWFMVAAKAPDADASHEARAEIEALQLAPQEHRAATSRAAELEQTITRAAPRESE